MLLSLQGIEKEKVIFRLVWRQIYSAIRSVIIFLQLCKLKDSVH